MTIYCHSMFLNVLKLYILHTYAYILNLHLHLHLHLHLKITPGRPAPVLITQPMISTMKPGSVILDMAASLAGGNVEGSVVNTIVTSPNNIKVIHNNTIFIFLIIHHIYAMIKIIIITIIIIHNNK